MTEKAQLDYLVVHNGKEYSVKATNCEHALKKMKNRYYFGKRILPDLNYCILQCDALTNGDRWAFYLAYDEDNHSHYVRVTVI